VPIDIKLLPDKPIIKEKGFKLDANLLPDQPALDVNRLPDKPQPSFFKKMISETGAQLQDLIHLPAMLTGQPHPPMASKLATETIPHLLEKATTPIGTFDIPTLPKDLRDIGKETMQISPTPLDIGFYGAFLGYPAFQNIVAKQQWNLALNKIIATEKLHGAVLNNMPAIEKALAQTGFKLPANLPLEDKANIIIQQAQKSPTLGNVIAGLAKGKITPRPGAPIETVAVKEPPPPAFTGKGIVPEKAVIHTGS